MGPRPSHAQKPRARAPSSSVPELSCCCAFASLQCRNGRGAQAPSWGRARRVSRSGRPRPASARGRGGPRPSRPVAALLGSSGGLVFISGFWREQEAIERRGAERRGGGRPNWGCRRRASAATMVARSGGVRPWRRPRRTLAARPPERAWK
ncbi:MAG: hypothetical protein J3K34DRAFT_279506 [Monoraphidium minutum]|nr:MAG: hypothetical protein J3K34DRAFT_279506 [Monoraphidium minutum]